MSKEIKDLNKYILKCYWRMLSHVNLCSIGGFQCALINIDNTVLPLNFLTPRKNGTLIITSFAKWWSLYRNTIIDFVIYYSDFTLSDIGETDRINKTNSPEEIIIRQQKYTQRQFTIEPVTNIISPNRFIKYFTRDYERVSSNIYIFTIPSEYPDLYVNKYTEINKFEKVKINPFKEVLYNCKEQQVKLNKYNDGHGQCGNFTSDGNQRNNIFYEYDNLYIWCYLNYLLRQNVKINTKDSYLTEHYTFPKRDGWRPIVNRGVSNLSIIDLMEIGYKTISKCIRTKNDSIDAYNTVLTYGDYNNE